MLSKCANVRCSEKFLSLHKGRLFHLVPSPEIAKASPRIEASLQERFWLCERCSQTMTLIWAGARVQVVPLPSKTEDTEAKAVEQILQQLPPRKHAARAGSKVA